MILQKLGALLHQCSRTRSVYDGVSIHAVVIKMGVESDLFICNHLINMYAKGKILGAAHQILDWMPETNLVSWSAMIAGYEQAGKPLLALDLFAQLPFQPNEYIYASVIRSCQSLSALSLGKQVHAHSLITGYHSISFVSNSLISMYMKSGCLKDAFSTFSSTSEPNSVSYNVVITGFVESSEPEKGLELFRLMNQCSMHPDHFSYVAVLGICSKSENMESGFGLHCQTIKLGLDATAFVGNMILTMYSRHSLFGEVEKAFRSIQEKDVITCNTYIAACSRCGAYDTGLMVYRDMEDAFGVIPDDFTLAGALAASAEIGSIRYGGQIHARLIRIRWDFDVGVHNSIINMYAKCGFIGYANHLFYSMPYRNLVSWNTMIIGFANHGLGKIAVQIFEQMRGALISPDPITFIGLLTACSHAGLVDEGLAYFNLMKETYSIFPKVEHLSCLIDLLGRAGRLEEAETYVETSPFRDDSIIWGSLLSSCRIHGNATVGERSARKLLNLRPKTSSPYVLLSSLYASDERWDEVAEAWKMLKGNKLKKEPGHSLIEVKGVTEKFTVQDLSHSRIEEILEALSTLNLMAQKINL